MASNSGTNKRRRTAADTLHISDLPIGFIVDVSAFLSKPSRAILAVALSAPSSSWQSDNLMHRPSPISAAITSAQQWDMLDFEDIEKELANKLTDNDISAVLKCINAQDVLRRLKLCGCVNITGRGLNPLRNSIILEQIDISLIRKYEKPSYNKPRSKISEEAVVPILDSIISSDDCSLKYIQFPMKWRAIGMNGIEDNPLMVLQRRFNALLSNRAFRGVNCIHCAVRIHPAQN